MAYDLKHFKFWCQKVLPLVYDDSLSYYEVLCKLTDYINKMLSDMATLSAMVEEFGPEGIAKLRAEMAALQAELDAVKNGEYAGLYVDAMAAWIDKNLQTMVGKIVQYVFFGLSADGHFVAYIPESWDFMSFDSIVDPEEELYGHLLVRW